MTIIRVIKNKINDFTKLLLLKAYNVSKDNRLTKKPQYEIFLNQRPGIKHPEIAPSLPLLEYVHNNSPAIKVATQRLRESIFRRGFEWERKFESKCSKCGKEFEDIVQKCEECHSKNIVLPSNLDTKRADTFFEKCNIYNVHKYGKRKLIHFLKEIEDDINIYDDAYIIGVKEYWQDVEGEIVGSTLHQIIRGNPVIMRMVVDEFGELGGRWWTCLRHRDIIEEIEDKKCPKCNRKLYEVHYVSTDGGGDNPMAYYIGDEVIHVSKYHPSAIYGFSPIVTLWQTVLTLTNMTEYIYKAYSEAHLPKGVLAMKTSNPDSAYEFWRDVDDKLMKDPHYIPKMFLEGEGNGTGSGMEFVKFMDTLEEMQYIPVRDEIRRTIASIYGVTNIFIGDTTGVGGLNSESTQIDITNMAAEAGIAVYNEHILPELLNWLHITDWKYVLQSPFEENIQRELNENQSKVQIAQSMQMLGFDIALGEEDVFEFKYSGTAKKQDMGGFGGFPQQNTEIPPQEIGEEEKSLIEKSRIYIKHPNEAPPNSKIQRSPRGSLYYETKPVVQLQRPNEQTLEMEKKRRIETLLQHANEHYDNILEEYKAAKDINPGHAMSLQSDLEETRNLIGSLHRNYQELFGNQPKVEKESEGQNININIQKEKVYVDNPSKVPSGKQVQEGPKGGHFYEGGEKTSEQLSQNQKTPQKVLNYELKTPQKTIYRGIASNSDKLDFEHKRRSARKYTEQTAGAGIYFASSKEIAEIYANRAKEEGWGESLNIIEYELNPNAKTFDYNAPIKGNEDIVKSLISEWYTGENFDDEQQLKAESIVDEAIEKSSMFEGSELGAPGTIGRAIEEIRVDLNDANLLNTESPGSDLSNNIERKGYSIIHYETNFPPNHHLLEVTNGKNYESWLVLNEKGLKNSEIKKYIGEQEDIYQMKKFKEELNKIFDEEMSKVLNSTQKFSGDDIKKFTEKCLNDAIYKMNIHTKQFLEKAYASGQEYVAKAVKQSINFEKIDNEAINAILNKHVLWNSYENLAKSTSERINTIIIEGFKDPKTFSVHNLVEKMREVANSENYRLERIARTEVHAAAMKGREVSFQKTDLEGNNRYIWAVRHDTRTSDVCKEIETLVEKEGNGKGVPLSRLNEIIKEVSMKYGGKNWEYRSWVPHISCRSGLLKAFD